MVNPKYIVMPDTSPTRVCHHSRTPTHILFSKPLPPRPASTDVTSPRQRRAIQSEWQPDFPAIEQNLKRAPARRGRRSPSDGIFPDCDPRYEHDISSCTPSDHQYSPRPRRSQSCMPTNLIWLEEEEQWVVGSRYVSDTRDYFHNIRAPAQTPTSPVSPLSLYRQTTSSLETDRIAHDHRPTRDELLNLLSPHGSHEFGPPLAIRSGNERV